MAKKKPLSDQQQRFIEFYAKGLDRKVAMAKAGYKVSNWSSAKTTASKILAHPDAKGLLKELREGARHALELEVADFVQMHLQWAHVDPRDYFRYRVTSETVETDEGTVQVLQEGFVLKPFEEIPDHAWGAVAGMKQTKDGFEIKFVDRQKALNEAAELLGLKQTVGGAIGDGMQALVDILNGVAKEESEQDLLPSKR